jgi:hypothetical protein
VEGPHNELSDAAHQVLISEFEQLSAAFIANEQGGDARVNIFVAAAGAVLAAIGFTNGPQSALGPATSFLAICFIVVLGWFTLNRIIRRNLVTDDYLIRISSLRRTFEAHCPELVGKLPFPTNLMTIERRLKLRSFAIPDRGGLAEVTIFINGAVVGALLAIFASWITNYIAVIAGSALGATILAWAGQFVYVNWRYRRGQGNYNSKRGQNRAR